MSNLALRPHALLCLVGESAKWFGQRGVIMNELGTVVCHPEQTS